MTTLPEVLASLAEYIGDDSAKAKEVARALRDSKGEHADTLNPLAQVLIDVGAGKKKGESDKTVAEKQAEIDRLAEALESANEAAEVASKKPNELQADFDKRRLKLEEKAAKLETDLKAERDGRRTDRVSYAASTPLRFLNGAVDPDYLAEVVAPRLTRRVRPTEAGVEYLDEHETPYDGDEQQQAKALADDTLKAVPDKYRLRSMNPGGGSSNGGDGLGSGKTPAQLRDAKLKSGIY